MTALSFKLIRLNFQGPLLLSRGRAEYTSAYSRLHSDTLKSALYVSASQLCSDIDAHSFMESFRISSAFPWSGEEFYFPKPMTRLHFEIPAVEAESKRNKKLKKIEWLGKSLFENELAGETSQVGLHHFSADGKFISERDIDKNHAIILREEQTRVQLNMEQDAEPYNVEKTFFAESAGLFFLLEANEDMLPMLNAAIRLLGDNGLGSYRHVGLGRFTSELEEISIKAPADATHHLNLSLYCPRQDEINKEMLHGAGYSLEQRGGWITNPEPETEKLRRKRSVYMFGEGSVFSTSGPLDGRITDLRPEGYPHAVLRDGRAIFIPIKVSENA